MRRTWSGGIVSDSSSMMWPEPFLKLFGAVIFFQVDVFGDHDGDAVPVAQRVGDGVRRRS